MVTILVILLILWFFGLLSNIGGNFIHALLLIAVLLFIYNQAKKTRQ